MTEDLPRWATYKEVSEYLNVDERTIRRAIARGDVKARKFSGALRIDRDSLLEYFAEVEVYTA